MNKTIVIEVRGGMVQEVYHNLNDVTVVLVDWDNIKEDDGDAEEYVAVGLKRMPDETREQVEKVTLNA